MKYPTIVGLSQPQRHPKLSLITNIKGFPNFVDGTPLGRNTGEVRLVGLMLG